MRKPSKALKREAERKAAEEFFSRRNRPPTQFRTLDPEPQQQQSTQTPTGDLPRAGSILSVEESKAIFARLASGDIKQVRR